MPTINERLIEIESYLEQAYQQVDDADTQASSAEDEANSARSCAEDAASYADQARSEAQCCMQTLSDTQELVEAVRRAVLDATKNAEDTKAKLAAAKDATEPLSGSDVQASAITFDAKVKTLWINRSEHMTKSETIAYIAQQLYVEYSDVETVVRTLEMPA